MKFLRTKTFRFLRIVFQMVFFSLVCFLFLVFYLRSFSGVPISSRKHNAILHLEGLGKSIRQDRAAERMQWVFPEGACFTLTLYGLAWTNLARSFPEDTPLRARAIKESLWVVDQYEKEYVLRPFENTQVRNGVFWLGQKNLLTAQLLEIMKAEERPGEMVEEFHGNCESLAHAFQSSPTKHLDTFVGFCWPADNVAALLSLTIHDDLYKTDYGRAYREWLEWTNTHLDPDTDLPAGQIDRLSGDLLQPARGCANSWILGLLASRDPEAATKWYIAYREHFRIKRMGFYMFREYREGLNAHADIDSGPILFGAGLAATGIGLSPCLALGDYETAIDIHALANMWGLPRSVRCNDVNGRQYLFDLLPVGDAFLSWAYSQPEPGRPISSLQGFWNIQHSRMLFHMIAAVVILLLVLRGYFLSRSIRKEKRFFAGTQSKGNGGKKAVEETGASFKSEG